VPDETSVIIKYNVTVSGPEEAKIELISNTVSMMGYSKTSEIQEYVISSSSATVTGRNGSVKLIKKGKYYVNGKYPTLQGATFKLYRVDDLNNPTGEEIDEQTTNSAGQITFMHDGEEAYSLKTNTVYYYKET